MLVCASCRSNKVEELLPFWVDANTGEPINDARQWTPIDTYCSNCNETGVTIICEEDTLYLMEETKG